MIEFVVYCQSAGVPVCPYREMNSITYAHLHTKSTTVKRNTLAKTLKSIVFSSKENTTIIIVIIIY